MPIYDKYIQNTRTGRKFQLPDKEYVQNPIFTNIPNVKNLNAFS